MALLPKNVFMPAWNSNVGIITVDGKRMVKLKHSVIAHGDASNPYLATYLIALEEKQREIERKLLLEEQRHLFDMVREYSALERSKVRERTDREKWDKYWSERLQDRIKKEKQAKYRLYYDISTPQPENFQLVVIPQKRHSRPSADVSGLKLKLQTGHGLNICQILKRQKDENKYSLKHTS